MKKIVVLLFIVLSIFGLSSCLKDVSPQEILDSVKIKFSGDDSIESVTSHLTLPTTSDLNENFSFVWETDHPLIIDKFGTVNQPLENTEVKLTLTISFNGLSESKDFNVLVLGLYPDVTVEFRVSNQTYQTVKVKYGDLIDPFDHPTLQGYMFDGWYIAPGKTVAYDFSMPIKSSMTIEAKFTLLPVGNYILEIYDQNINDDDYTLLSRTTESAPLGEQLHLTPSKVGFELNTELSSVDATISEVTSTIKLYYNRNSYTIELMNEDVEIGTFVIKYGELISFPNNLVKEGYELSGWTTDLAGENYFDENGFASSNLTLYAKWSLPSNTIDDFDFTGFNNYYAVLSSSSNVITDLAKRLRNTIRYVSYGDARYVYVKYDNESQVILYDVPSSTSYRKVPAYGTAGWGTGGNISGSGFSISINREHVWAASDMRIMPTTKSGTISTYVGFNINDGSFDYRPGSNTSKGHHTDLHNLWNSLAGPNNTHSDHFFGEENGKSASPYLKNNAFYPGDEYRGDVARILFYMTLMYPHLTLVNKGSSNANEGSIYYGYLDVLMRWNKEDPVSYYEIERNQTIFASQGNRNPFVDYYHQDFAELLFANGDPNVLD